MKHEILALIMLSMVGLLPVVSGLYVIYRSKKDKKSNNKKGLKYEYIHKKLSSC